MRIDSVGTALVTGGAGFIGSNLVDGLVERGVKTRVLDDLSTGRESNLVEARETGRCDLVVGDIRDRATVKAALRGVDLVFHLAVSNLRVSLSDPGVSHEINAGGTLTVLEEAREAGIRRFVYCSSSEVYGSAVEVPIAEVHPLNPTTVYGASKLAGEKYALAFHTTYGFPTTVVRPFNTYGYREHLVGTSGEVIPRMVARALAGRPPLIFGDGTQSRDFTFVTDTVRGLIACAEEDELIGRAINIARGEEVEIRFLAAEICRQLGRDPDIEFIDERPGDVHRQWADVREARTLLEYEARIPISDGIRLYVEWLLANHPDVAALESAIENQNW
jgi:UDP-glucose 4-epimerase